MLAILFAFFCFLGWGIGDIFTAQASRKMGSYNASFYGYAIGLILSALYIPFALDQFRLFTLPLIILTTILTICQVVGFLSFNEGLKIGIPSLVGTIAGSFTSLVVILSLIFLHEKLTMLQICIIIVIFVGLVLSSLHTSDLKKLHTVFNKGTVYAIIALVGWAIYYTFIKIPIQSAGFYWPTFTSSIVGVLFLLLIGAPKIKKMQLTHKSGFPTVTLSAILLTAGTFSFNIALGLGKTSIVAPISGAYPALFAFLAYKFFREPISKQQKIGMIITLSGIVLLSYFSA